MHISIIPLQESHITPLAHALFAAWHDFAPWSSVDKIRGYYHQCVRDEDLPLAFAAVDEQGNLLGSAALKRYDIAAYADYEYWLGDVFVLPKFRNMGVGKALVEHVLQAARAWPVEQLYLYTPDMQAVYAAFGWREVDTHWYNGETVSIMELDLCG